MGKVDGVAMTDIVERLRSLADEWYEMCGDIHEPLGEAADTIERLRAEVAWHEEENHRLRAALHKIAEWDLTGTAIAALGEDK